MSIVIRSTHRLKAFTLLELATVLLIIGLVTAMAMSSGVAVVRTARQSATEQKIRAIQAALQSYREMNSRLPCPADLTIAEGATNYGVEFSTPGTCTSANTTANRTAAGATNTSTSAIEGTVPVVALGLPNDMMYDGWGHRFRYVVDVGVTALGAFTNIASACENRAIAIEDSTDSLVTPRTGGAVYAIISHGENGHGGYTKNGVITNAGAVNSDELVNCHCDSSAANTAYAPTYVQKSPTLNPLNSNDSFNDIVAYKERWQMMASWEVPKSCAYYIYVVDQNNNRVEKFDNTGNFIASYPVPSGTEYVLVLSSTTLLVQDYTGHRVNVTTTGGTITSSIGTSYLSGTEQMAFDSTGTYVWVADGPGNRALKFLISNPTGAPVQYIPSTCTSPCSSSTTPGQFNYPEGISLDASGNVYITDYNNYRVQKFDSSGTFVWTQGSNGGSAGTFSRPNSVASDSQSNVWVVDTPNDRVQELKGSDHSFIKQLGCGGGFSACTTYSTNGWFNNPDTVAVDKYDNIWVTDTGNNRVQEFKNDGTLIMQIGCATGFCSSSSAPGAFNAPNGITISSY